LKHLEDLPHAPSVGLQAVPGENLADHLGYSFDDGEDEELSELDERIAGEPSFSSPCRLQ
jgi:histone deacetylase 1/2